MVRRIGAALIALACAAAPHVWGYALTGSHWGSTPVTMHLQLGSSGGALLDGFSSWGASAEDALTTWNDNIRSVQFGVVRDSTLAKASSNGVNNVFFSDTVYGSAWGSGVLAVTLSYSSGTRTTECDVLFNNLVGWNSYRGPQRSGTSGAIYDFHRVALHEFGHVLGLDHPDQAGQSVTALMNSRISSLDALAADDIAGAQSLYGAPGGGSTVIAATAPTITSQPSSRSVTAGQAVSFSVSAGGTAPLSYQWLKKGGTISGANGATFSIGSASTSDAGGYSVVVSNSAGSITSNTAMLTVTTAAPPPAPVIVAPTISSQPVARAVAVGASVSFSVQASGTAPLSYLWFRNGIPVAGTSATLTLDHVQPADAGAYHVRVSNSAGAIDSASATLTVQTPPSIVTPPAGVALNVGDTLSLATVASGSPTPTLQWWKNGTAIAGATGATFSRANAQPADAGAYSVVATNAAGSAASAAAIVTVLSLPSIAAQPQAQSVAAGADVSFSVTANGATSFQWRKNGVDVPGATTSALTLPNVQPEDAAEYSVALRNAAGSVVSAVAMLDVKFSRLINLSTRGYVAPGAALTPGFVLRGRGAKPLLIRGVGPTLERFGIAGTLAQPQLAVIPSGAASPLLTSASWDASADLARAFSSVGAFPLASSSADAAIQGVLPPDAYSVRVTSVAPSEGGVALAEIYDSGDLAAATRLINASTLGFLGPGERALTPGFVIRGNAPKRLLIRAIGPGLAQFGIADFVADPSLSVLPLGDTQTVAASDDWAGSAELNSAFAQIGAFALADASKDAAVVATLPPGAYSVILSGGANATGTVLFELYDLDP